MPLGCESDVTVIQNNSNVNIPGYNSDVNTGPDSIAIAIRGSPLLLLMELACCSFYINKTLYAEINAIRLVHTYQTIELISMC